MEKLNSITIILLIVASLAAAVPVLEQHNPYEVQSYQQLQQQSYPSNQKESCHGLCEACGCRGYYCGDECICQCNWADESNVKCIQNKRAKSQKMAYPFEVLIQGPAGRRFVREATDIDPETMATYKQNERSGRSVYSIYKPNQVGKGGLMAVEGEGGDATVGAAAPIKLGKVLLTLADRRNQARLGLASLTSKIGLLGSASPDAQVGAADPSVAAAAPEADPTVAAPSPDPTVGAAEPAKDPEVAAAAPPADPTVAAAAPATAAEPVVAAPAPEPVVGSSKDPISPIWRNWPRITVTPPTWSKDFFKRLGAPMVAAPGPIIQPDHTL